MYKITALLFIVCFSPTILLAQWSDDPTQNSPIALASGEEAIPKVATSVNGFTYISWFSNESGNYNVRLQKLDVFGNNLWADEGLLVSDNPAMTWLTDWDMTVDQEDYAILAFQDIRNGDNDVFAYRISPDQEFVWGTDGIEMSTGPAFDASPKVCVTNSGNAVFAWQADDVVILQKISPTGIKLWGENGMTLSGSNTFSWPQLLPVSDDDVILKYFEDSGPIWAPTRHVFAQRYDSDGNAVWDTETTISNAGGISAWTQVFSFINDGNDGFFIAWHDDRDFNNLSSVFVQQVSSDGQVLLGDDGTEASTMAGRHNFYPYLALPEGSDEIFVFWNEMDGDQNNRGIYGQKISESGDRLWTDNGKAFIEISSTNVYPFAASQSDMNMMVFYEQYFDGLNAGIYTMQIDSDGEFVWENDFVVMSTVQSEKVHPVAGHMYNDQWIAVWEDSRNGGRDIYGQNIKIDGTLGPVTIPAGLTFSNDTIFLGNGYPYEGLTVAYNNSANEIVINDYNEFGMPWLWEVFPYIPLPYTIEPNDSLEIYIQIIWSDITEILDFDYNFLIIETGDEVYEIVVAVQQGLVNTADINIQNELQVYPNPSNTFVNFEYNLPENDVGELIIFDPDGRIIKLMSLSGNSEITWDGRNESGLKVPPGSYFYRLITDNFSESGSIIMLE